MVRRMQPGARRRARSCAPSTRSISWSRRGEVLGLVGESGCGKSTLGRMVAGIMPPTEGQVLYHGQDRSSLQGAAARDARLRVQMIFQDPYASLNPRLRVSEIVGEAPRVHGLTPRPAGLCRPAAAPRRARPGL